MPREIEIRTVLNKKKKRDHWFLDEYTLNLYSSCSFNCLYCYIRGSKYGTNLESSLSVKINAIEVLDRQLTNRAKKGQYGIIVISSATDPYLHLEKKYLNAIKMNYPQLENKYLNYFKDSSEMPGFYRNAFYKKMKELCIEYGITDNILKAAGEKRPGRF